jgi:hypothetical protein
VSDPDQATMPDAPPPATYSPECNSALRTTGRATTMNHREPSPSRHREHLDALHAPGGTLVGRAASEFVIQSARRMRAIAAGSAVRLTGGTR